MFRSQILDREYPLVMGEFLNPNLQSAYHECIMIHLFPVVMAPIMESNHGILWHAAKGYSNRCAIEEYTVGQACFGQARLTFNVRDVQVTKFRSGRVTA